MPPRSTRLTMSATSVTATAPSDELMRQYPRKMWPSNSQSVELMPACSSAAERVMVVSRQVPSRLSRTSAGVRTFCPLIPQLAGGSAYRMSRARIAS